MIVKKNSLCWSLIKTKKVSLLEDMEDNFAKIKIEDKKDSRIKELTTRVVEEVAIDEVEESEIPSDAEVVEEVVIEEVEEKQIKKRKKK